MNGEALDWITIRNLRVECVIGVFGEERTRLQPVVATLRLGLRPRGERRSTLTHETVDYLALAGQVTFLLRAGRFKLIETAAEALASYLLTPPSPGERRAAIERVAVRLHKPRALPPPATAQIAIERAADPGRIAAERGPFGAVDVIFDDPEVAIYRLSVAPDAEVPPRVEGRRREHELVLTRGLVVDGREVFPGTAFHWPAGAPHYYQNPTSAHQTILCIDAPSRPPADEKVVGARPAKVVVEHLWAPRTADGWPLSPG
jgi:dihydroneopterin aldolase